MLNTQCSNCADAIALKRAQLGYKTCLRCGELKAKAKKHCIVPLHKSNYTVITDKSLLRGINAKYSS